MRVGAPQGLGLRLQVSVGCSVNGRLERGSSVNIGLQGEAVLFDDKRKNATDIVSFTICL